MSHYRVRNWASFQHYRHRDPPWIKLHFSILSSPDWVMLDDAGRVLAVACMLIASRNKGLVPNNPDYLRRVAYLESVNFKPLIDCGFLVSDASNTLADASECLQVASSCVQMLNQSRVEESREETTLRVEILNPREPPTLETLKLPSNPVAAELSACLTANGIKGQPFNPRVREWADAGFTVPQLQAAIAKARENKPAPENIPLAYLDPILRSPPKAGSEFGTAWRSDDKACDEVGRKLGISAKRGEGYSEFRQRIAEKIREVRA